jgi:hypothetical protein
MLVLLSLTNQQVRIIARYHKSLYLLGPVKQSPNEVNAASALHVNDHAERTSGAEGVAAMSVLQTDV